MGRKRRASKAKRRGQDRAASLRGFLTACGGSAGPSAATWSPFSKAAWGLPGASEISSQRDLLLPVLRLLTAEGEGQRSGDGMGCMITTSWPCGQEATRVKRDGGVGRGSALGSPTLRDTEA